MDQKTDLITLFESYLTIERRSSPHTVVAYTTDLVQFSNHLSTVQAKSLTTVSRQDLRGWLVSLAKEGLNNSSINRKMAAIRTFYLFLQKRGELITLPTHALKSLKKKKNLPIFLQEKELLSALDQYPSTTTFANLRDKLVLELLYGTGMRLAELLTLREVDIHGDGTIKVIGKRNKERIIPFPKPLKGYIAAYLMAKNNQGYHPSPTLLVTDRGNPCYPMFIYRIVKKYLATTTRASQHSPHILRHTFATHLLDKGADLQSIKELLGHSSLAATQIYTHNSLAKLKEVFKKAHPRAEE
ncbi:MAG: tyrosine-type recombinase/integrase [Amoebophilaceae bacterium]|nr:tyrosine-type recombinase/integrase [Amoebophilaceae bacterium]